MVKLTVFTSVDTLSSQLYRQEAFYETDFFFQEYGGTSDVVRTQKPWLLLLKTWNPEETCSTYIFAILYPKHTPN